MKNLRKVLALVLAVVMAVSTLTVTFAAEKTSGEVLKALGLVTGNETGDLMEDKEISRAEAAQILVKVMGWDLEPASAYTFADDTWAKAQAATLVKKGITSGVGDNNFGGTKEMTALEVYAWVYAALTSDTKSAWANPDLLIEILSADQIATVVATKNKPAKRSEIFDGMTTILTKVGADGLTQLDRLVKAEKVTEAQVEAAGLKTIVGQKIVKVQATKVNELKVTFDKAVDTTDVTLAVTKATASVAGEVTWNADKTVATFTATANLTAGTYTVTATSAANKTSVTGSVDVVNQYANTIVIKNEIALTNDDTKEAYVYYDVLDQYGESVRMTTTLNWSSSVTANADKTTGKITLKRPEGTYAYGEKIYLTGVDMKTGNSVQATLTVGQKQAVNKINIAGFVMNGTNTIVSQLPAGFKANTYKMVFAVADQNGNPMDISKLTGTIEDYVTFVTDNALLISSISKFGTNLTIDGIDYATVEINPGINVSKGGEVNILSIATKTGSQTTKNIVIGESQVLTSFEMSAPSAIITEGSSATIPFVAIDQDGNQITNFATIAKGVDFNSLSFTVSSGKLKLSESAEGTASLEYTTDTTIGWDDSRTTDGIDRQVSLTSIVVGGNSSNLMISVQDKARPVGIKDVNMDNILVHQGSTKVKFSDITFVDQYGKTMKHEDAFAFFEASAKSDLKGIDFADYEYYVRATYKGTSDNYSVDKSNVTIYNNLRNDDIIDLRAGETIEIKANVGTAPKVSSSGMSFRFEIVRKKASEVESVSPVRTETGTIINITQVKSVVVNDIAKVYIPTTNTGNTTGAVIGNTAADWNEKAVATKTMTVGVYGYNDGHKREVSLAGTYNGVAVTIPSDYYEAEANKLTIVGNIITGAKTELLWKDLYDITTAQYTRKDGADTVTVKLYNTTSKADKTATNVLTTATKAIAISDAKPALAAINGADSYGPTNSPTNTVMSVSNTFNSLFKNDYSYKDQYGAKIDVELSFKVSNVVERADGYAANNFTYTSNDSNQLTLTGVERGDTFVITVKANCDGVVLTKDVEFTANTDAFAYLESTNEYANTLLKTLEAQRIASMGN